MLLSDQSHLITKKSKSFLRNDDPYPGIGTMIELLALEEWDQTEMRRSELVELCQEGRARQDEEGLRGSGWLSRDDN